MKDNVKIASELIDAAKEILAADYVYDPDHKHKPRKGGNWHKTPQGWSNIPNTKLAPSSFDEEDGTESKKTLNMSFKKDMERADASESAEELDDLSRRQTYAIRDRVARNPHTSIETLMNLMKDEKSEVRSSVAQNPNTTEDMLATLSKDYNMRVQGEVARNKKTPEKILRYLAREAHLKRNIYDDNPIAAGLAGNENAPVDILKRMSKYNHRDVWENLANNPRTPKSLRAIAQENLENNGDSRKVLR